MLNPVREGEEDYIEAIRYRRRLKIFKNFLFDLRLVHAYFKRSGCRFVKCTLVPLCIVSLMSVYRTVEPHLTVTSLIKPPRYYGQFILSWRKAHTL